MEADTDVHREAVMEAFTGCREDQIHFVLKVICLVREHWPQHCG